MAPDARFDPRRFELATRHAKNADLLARKITAGIGRPASLCEVVDYLGAQTNATFLIDEPALAGVGLASETEARLIARDQPLEQALEHVLMPLGLVYRVVDNNVLEITSPASVARRRSIDDAGF